MSNQEKNVEINKIIADLRAEEDTENQLIWLYQTLLDLGIENCFNDDHASFFREGMKKLYQDSQGHKLLIEKIISKYEKL